MTTVVNTSTMKTAAGEARYLSLAKLASSTGADVASLPHTVQDQLVDENLAAGAGAVVRAHI